MNTGFCRPAVLCKSGGKRRWLHRGLRRPAAQYAAPNRAVSFGAPAGRAVGLPLHDAAGDRLFGGAADFADAGHRSGAALGPQLPIESQCLLVSVLQLERQPFLPFDAVLPPPARRDHHRPVRAAAVRPLWAAKGLTAFL